MQFNPPNLMKSFCQTDDAVVLSFLMDTTDDNQTPPSDQPDSPAVEPTVPPAPAAGEGKGSPLRQLGQNLLAGVRLALSLRVSPDQLCGAPWGLAQLVLLDLLLNLAVSYLLVGRGGYFAYASLPGFFFHLPLFLYFGLLAGRLLATPSLAVALPVALVALSIPIELTHALLERIGQLRQFNFLEDYLEATHYYRFYWWWVLTALLFLLRLPKQAASRRSALICLFLVLVASPLWYYSRGDLWSGGGEAAESGELHLTDRVLSAQARLLDDQLAALHPGRLGVSDLYFVGFAGDATQDVFLKEATAAQRLFRERFGTLGRSVLLANNPRSAATIPFATVGNLERALTGVGKVMNREEDILFLFLTSHGSRQHELAVNNRPLELEGLTPEKVRRMLEKSGITWKVVVVSACYAGGFIEPLKDDHTLIITAADASHESFGCGVGENFTWFGEAFIDDALRQSYSFTDAFSRTRETIRQWEDEQGETPSNPQIFLGKAIEPKLARLERELVAERRERQDR